MGVGGRLVVGWGGVGLSATPHLPSWLSRVAKRPTRTKHSRGSGTQPHCWEGRQVDQRKAVEFKERGVLGGGALIDRWMD